MNSNTFYWADDYSILNELNEFGIIKRCINGYLTWDGRYLTPACFFQGLFLSFLPIQLITLFWTFLFLLSGYFLTQILEIETDIKYLNKTNKITIYLLIIIALFFCSTVHLSQTVFWATGGVYTFNLFIGSLWLYLFTRNKNTNKHKVLLTITTVLASLSTQNLIIPLIIFIIIKNFTERDYKFKFKIFLLIILFSGLIFINFAPGNEIRISEVNDNLIDNFSLSLAVKNTFRIAYIYSKHSLPLIGFAIILFLFKRKRLLEGIHFYIPNTKSKILSFLDSNIYAIVAISSVLPFIISPFFASERTSIYFIYFILIYVLKLYFTFYNKIFYSKRLVFIIVIFQILLISFYLSNFVKGIELKNEITKRECKLVQSKNKNSSIEIIKPETIPYLYKFREPKGNDDWALEQMKNYYNIQNLYVKE